MTRALQFAVAMVSFAALAHSQNVGVFLDFDAAPSRTSLEAMKKEAAELLKPSGIALDWRLAAENRGNESFDGLVLMRFKGKCRAQSWSTGHPPGGTSALGSTEVANGHVLPFSEVKCDALQQALSYLRPETNPVDRQRALGLAMGRVVAHELYHVLADARAHAAKGMSRAVESLPDLVSTRPTRFSAEASEAIRNSFR